MQVNKLCWVNRESVGTRNDIKFGSVWREVQNLFFLYIGNESYIIQSRVPAKQALNVQLASNRVLFCYVVVKFVKTGSDLSLAHGFGYKRFSLPRRCIVYIVSRHCASAASPWGRVARALYTRGATIRKLFHTFVSFSTAHSISRLIIHAL